jgi:hypothetical protein
VTEIRAADNEWQTRRPHDILKEIPAKGLLPETTRMVLERRQYQSVNGIVKT